MNKKEVLELKRRFQKDKASFSILAGCYVNEKREKVCTFLEPFQGLQDDVVEKYLEIAGKTLSGSLKNNLLEIEFPLSEELPGGRQQLLMALRECGLKNEDLLDVFYDSVIQNYTFTGHYMILLFMDRYDVPFKTGDGLSSGESDEIFSYILSCICPVELSKPGLSYLPEDNRIGARLRDWVVGMPESGFLFPSFSGRTADVHSTLVYAKNPKAPHDEFVENILGCNNILTQAEQRVSFHTIVKQVLGTEDTATEEKLLGIQQHLKEQTEAYEEAYAGEEVSPLLISDSLLKEAMDQNAVSENEQSKILSLTNKTFGDSLPEAAALVDEHALKAGTYRLEVSELTKELAEKTLEAEHLEKELVSVSKLRLRPMKYDDLNTILSWVESNQVFRFWTESPDGIYPNILSSMNEVYHQFETDPDYFPLSVFNEDNQLVGHLVLHYADPQKTEIILSHIIVNSNTRNQEIGQKMTALAVRYSKLFLGAKNVSLEVFRDNTAARRAFEHAGFKEKALLGYSNTEHAIVIDGDSLASQEMIWQGK